LAASRGAGSSGSCRCRWVHMHWAGKPLQASLCKLGFFLPYASGEVAAATAGVCVCSGHWALVDCQYCCRPCLCTIDTCCEGSKQVLARDPGTG
jgi:hypothetical protein